MIELPAVLPEFVQAIIQNFTIIATLVLLYNFVPDSVLSKSRQTFPLGVGIIFGLAAALSIPALWQTTDAPVLGFNVILVPLAGYAGGPISSAVVAAVLLLAGAGSGEALSGTDIMTVMNGVLLGALVYYGRSWNRFPQSALSQLLILGAGVALIETFAFIITDILQPGPATAPGFISIIPFLVLSFCGTVILGSIIVFIDRKKQAERELLDYRDHLEALVYQRTTELRQANSLQKATIESTADAIVVVDRDGIIRAYNQKAGHLLGLTRIFQETNADGPRFTDTAAARLTDPEGFVQLIAPLPEPAEQVVSTNLVFQTGRIFELYVHPQKIGDRTTGRVFSFHDITDQRHAEEELYAAHKKLLLLAQVTRHDIVNQLTALGIHLDLAREKGGDSPALNHIDAMQKILEVIRLQLEFTRDYQNLGEQKPEWKEIRGTFIGAADTFSGRGIDFRCEIENLEIFCDPMIGRVFYNFIENSIRHGERVTEVRLYAKVSDPDLVLVYEDNGSGVAPEEKEKIFLKGFGRHTGLGMFLIREILSITGITIRETGTYGQGACFEIHIPAGKFRFTS